MTHFGENTEFIEDDPVNRMVPSDSTKTVSILELLTANVSIVRKFYKSNPRKKTYAISIPKPAKLPPPKFRPIIKHHLTLDPN